MFTTKETEVSQPYGILAIEIDRLSALPTQGPECIPSPPFPIELSYEVLALL